MTDHPSFILYIYMCTIGLGIYLPHADRPDFFWGVVVRIILLPRTSEFEPQELGDDRRTTTITRDITVSANIVIMAGHHKTRTCLGSVN